MTRMTEPHPDEGLRVVLVRAWPGRSESLVLRLPRGARVGEALDAARRAGWAITVDEAGRLAIFGRLVDPGAALHADDRIELLRPLLADPKQRRRARAAASRGPARA